MPPSIEVDAFIGLGANLGDRAATLQAAIDAIASLPETRLVARSSLWQTAPVGAAGGDYLNAVVRVATRLEPRALLDALLAIEARHGRSRPYANAARTLDLDLLLFGDRRIDAPGLVVPHPRLAVRAFVLAPLAEIAPELTVPGNAQPLSSLLAAVAGQRVAKLDR